MKIAIVGSRTFPVEEAGAALVEFLRELPEGTEVLTRPSDGLDRFVAYVCQAVGIPCELYTSDGARAEVYRRDVRMVRDADRVVAFFHPDSIGEGGTQHVVDKALDQGKPVVAYTVGELGELRVVGESGGGPKGGDADSAPWDA